MWRHLLASPFIFRGMRGSEERNAISPPVWLAQERLAATWSRTAQDRQQQRKESYARSSAAASRGSAMPSDSMYSVALLPRTGGRPLRAVKTSSEGRAGWTPSEARRNFLLARRLVGGATRRRCHTSDRPLLTRCWEGGRSQANPTVSSGRPSSPEPPRLRICPEVWRHHLSGFRKPIRLNSRSSGSGSLCWFWL